MGIWEKMKVFGDTMGFSLMDHTSTCTTQIRASTLAGKAQTMGGFERFSTAAPGPNRCQAT